MKKEMVSGSCLLVAGFLLMVVGGCSQKDTSIKVSPADEKQFNAKPTGDQLAQMNKMRADAMAKGQAAAQQAAAQQQAAGTKKN